MRAFILSFFTFEVSIALYQILNAKKDCKPYGLQPLHIYLQNRIQETLHLLTYLRLGYALDRLVSVSYMCYHTSTSDLSTSSSSRGLTTYVGISHLEGGFTLRCLQRLSLPGLATLPCSWQNNRYTSGQSIPVLSY